MMKCPLCGGECKVIESRPTEDRGIRRRRECLGPECGHRYTTYERIEEMPLVVVKKDGRRQVFDRGKVLVGLLRACHKRPVSIEQIESLVGDAERTLRNSLDREVPAAKIGRLVMERLVELDRIGYIRYASVYLECAELGELRQHIDLLLHDRSETES